ncbi:2-oxoacid:acceptor oxidoreductase subunit alpha [Desulfovibrio ferrophilus]|uniref:Pyruvate flavodoxin/ferredoxin oxidoreductase domain-containing protein n=1 Tax=Desulfovibrio ferrophilus TaxID=241368 RepID=A0A2Z6AXA2_9BACT|nr:2-oxoacid:acceptor oxidoreductase subunit alpha [Desulfovibrio ferrophilus]BBD07879.1 pyruvate flavodoxin/ferredoxin oxidoreductase domain-containing protein [Desulfovibrio ferrophilus]
MPEKTVNIMIGGAAGQGLATVGQLLTKSLIRSGYHVVVRQDYMSRVRGGHNTYIIRASVDEIYAPREAMDFLVALNQETVDLHLNELGDGGLIICDEALDSKGRPGLSISFKDLAPKPIFQNVAALGLLASLLGLDRDVPAKLLTDTFTKKGEAIVKQNHEVLDAAYAWVAEQNAGIEPLAPVPAPVKRLMMGGNEAIALGAMAAGVKFCSFYPMTPATSVAQNLITHGRELGVVVEQVEDEIAAMNMAIGASYAGARSLVPTSGGGFALMTEGVSLAAVAETPLVCVVAMRPGPATGLPTRTEQADLNLVLYAGHGEYPRAIFAPGTVEEAFRLAHRAFDQAERYQSPVFVLSDQFLADSFRSVEPFDTRSLPAPASPLKEWAGEGPYERYAVTDSGVSPRVIPGFSETLVVGDSHEHTPDGHITEDIEMRIEQKQKRLRKGCGLWEDVVAPSYIGPESPDVLLVSWGSTKGAADEAAMDLRADGVQAASLHFSQVWPLKLDQFAAKFDAAKKIVVVEGNATGQFAALLKLAGAQYTGLVLKYDGRPFTPEYIVTALHKSGALEA